MSLVDNDKMLDYIHEEQKYALHIFDNAETFVKNLQITML